MALITAVLFAFVATILMTAAAVYAVHELNITSIDRKEVQSSGAAGAAIDLAVSDLQSGTPPCSISGTLSSAPTTESYTATITYYNSAGQSLNSNCSGGVLPDTVTPASAVIQATGTNSASTTYGARRMQAEVTMAAVSAPNITDALFGNGGMSFAQTVTLYGQTSPSNNANVYSNGDWSCSQGGNVYGNLYVQGTVSSHCSVAGAVMSTGDQSLSAGYGSATAGGPSNPASSIDLNNGATVAGSATASGSISLHGGAFSASVDPNQTGLPGPTLQAFPTWDYSTSAWQNTGYTNFVNAGSDCTTLYSAITAMASPTAQPTVIVTSCQFSPSHTQPPYLLANNLAIFDSAGLNTSSATFESLTTASHDFYFIVPSTGLTVGNCSVTFHALSLTVGTSSNPLTALLYTPCDMSLSQATAMYGQLYAGGTLSVSQDFTLHYSPFSWPGASGGANASYSVNIVYERASP
ncbi:MAG: hypothetical protein ACYCZV_07075 [Acidimicrobiales bacterium]